MTPNARAGVGPIDVAGGHAFFSDASASPPGLSAEELARMAGSAVAGRLGHALPVLYARQEHTRLIYCHGSEAALEPRPHLVGICDGLITDEAGIVLTVRTADCLPIVLAGGGAVGIVHGGWRGLAADILGAAVARLAAEYGVAPPVLEAVVGVGIGPCHYRVGPEVIAALEEHAVSGTAWRHGDRVDLAAWAGGRLVALGLAEPRVSVRPGCTACSPSHHSFRRDGAAAGRQWSAVVLAAQRGPSPPRS